MPEDLTAIADRFRNLLIEKRDHENRRIETRVDDLLRDQLTGDDPLCGGWGDISDIGDNGLSYSGSTFGQMFSLAQAWATPGSRYEGSDDVASSLNAAWRFYSRFVHIDCEFPNNWWAWQIGIPMLLGNTVLTAAPAFEKDVHDDLVGTLGYLVEHIRPAMTGANGMWGAMNQLRLGLITNNADYVESASRWSARECEIRPVNGILPDYSYSFHGSAVHMGYGRSHFADVGRYVYLMGDSDWQLPGPALENYVNWLLEFIRWTIVGSGIDPFIIGREVSRGEAALLATSIIDGALLASSAPIPRRDEVLATCRRAIDDGLQPSNPVAVDLSSQKLNVTASAPLVGSRYWTEIEYFVARSLRFTASVKMSSPKTKSWFSIADENIKGWHTSDGHLILRMKDSDFLDGVIPTMDWERLTGTTRSDGIRMPRETEGQSTFVCGTVSEDGSIGCCGVDFLIRMEDDTTLRARKSWFLLENAIVALGSDISCDGPNEVETIVRQCVLPHDSRWNWGDDDSADSAIVHGHDCAYLFPEPTGRQTRTERRSGSWSDINLRRGRVSEDEETRDFAYLTIPHGIQPTDAGYCVVYLPGFDAQAAATWNRESSPDIIQRDSDCHSILDKASGRTLTIRWGSEASIS